MSKNTVRKKITGRQLMPGIFKSLAISFLLFLYSLRECYVFMAIKIGEKNETVCTQITDISDIFGDTILIFVRRLTKRRKYHACVHLY